MVNKARGELLSVTDRVVLQATFYDNLGQPVDADSFPTVSLIQPSGGVSRPPSSSGVQRVGVGVYSFAFDIPYGGPLGIWQDIWQGSVSGDIKTETLSFVVFNSNLPAMISPDGYYALGEDPGFHYSQTAILNINKLLKTLRSRLASSGKVQTIAADGSVITNDCDIFSVETLVDFLALSLSEINAVSYFTFFNFDHTNIIDLLHQVIVEGAVIYALGSQSLLERGREWTITDNGISAVVPTVSELMNTQYSQLLTLHFDRVKLIKNSMRPAVIGLGTLTMTNGTNPLARRLSTLRARRLF